MATDPLIEALADYARRYGSHLMREEGYSHLLFAHLSRLYENRLMIGTGIYLEDLLKGISAQSHEVQKTYLPKAWDLYPDLLIYEANVFADTKTDFNRIDECPHALAPVVLCEWKFTSSFPSMQRVHLLKDAVKLSLLAEYMAKKGYRAPRLIQVVFNFPHPRHGRPEDSFVRWYQDDEFKVNAPGLEAFMIFNDGRIIELTKGWTRT